MTSQRLYPQARLERGRGMALRRNPQGASRGSRLGERVVIADCWQHSPLDGQGGCARTNPESNQPTPDTRIPLKAEGRTEPPRNWLCSGFRGSSRV